MLKPRENDLDRELEIPQCKHKTGGFGMHKPQPHDAGPMLIGAVVVVGTVALLAWTVPDIVAKLNEGLASIR